MALQNKKLTVACVFWKGFFADKYKVGTKRDLGKIPVYTKVHVQKLQSMVSRHLPEPYRFVCLSNTEVPGVETIPLISKTRGWWCKIELFRPDLNLGDRILFLDLDTLIVANLNCLFDLADDFIVAPRLLRKRPGISSAVMVWDRGCGHKIWEQFDNSVTERLHGDQDWIYELYPNLPTIPMKYLLRNYKRYNPSGDNQIVIIPCGKPELRAEEYPWIDEIWR